MTRVATYSNHTLLSDLALRNASSVTDLRNQSSSGYKSRDYAGIADSTQRLLNLEGDVTRIDQYLKNATQAKLRLQNMESAVDTMTEIAVKMKTLLIQALSADQADDVNLDSQGRQAMEQIASLLNTNLDGRYLFAGGRSDQPAVDLDKIFPPDNYASKSGILVSAADTLASLGITDGTIEIVSSDSDGNSVTTTVNYLATDTVGDLLAAINGDPANGATASLRPVSEGGATRLNIENVGNGIITLNEVGGGNILTALGLTKIPNPRNDTSWYSGDQQVVQTRIDKNYNVDLSIHADNPAFQSLVQGLGIMAGTTDKEALGQALDHINNAIENLPNIQGKIGLDIANIERYESNHADFKVFASQVITDIVSVDIPLTLVKLSQFETALQASFMSIAGSKDLSLVNYIR